MTMLAAVVRQRSTPRLVAMGLYVFVFAAVGAWAPYMPVYLSSLGLPLDAIGLIATLGALCSLVAAPVWGVLSDQTLGARMAMIAAAALGSLCVLTVALASSAFIAAVVWIVFWLFFSGLGPVLDAFTLLQQIMTALSPVARPSVALRCSARPG